MAVPANPTVTTIVTQALKRAGRVTPSAVQIQEAIDYALQEVKADIMLKAPTHKNLNKTATAVTMAGQQRYDTPDDYNVMDSITLLDGATEWAGLAQAGSVGTITLASSFSATEAELIGKFILLTDGPGLSGYRQIINYNDSTKVVTVDVNWEQPPTGATNYQIITQQPTLWPWSAPNEADHEQYLTTLGTPQYALLQGQQFHLYPIPDMATYGLQLKYWADLSLIDEESDLFVQLLREWRSVWTQGVAVKSMQRFDEDRYLQELSVYSILLDALSSQTATIRQMRQED